MTSNDKQSIKIAVVGDVHNQWEAEDGMALQHLGVDLVLFVGDFGNEAVEVVRQIAALEIPKAVIMGNHDAWYTASHWGRKRSPYDQKKEDWVQQQLELLGATHVGYGKLDFPEFKLSVVGSRPFSWGGPEWKNEKFLRKRYGVNNFAESRERIVEAAQNTAYETLIFLAHNGPFGLGSEPEDICGKDWQPLGGDYGDPDLAEAITKVRDLGKKIPLVTFGHMHHSLRHTKERLRTTLCRSPQETVYLNAASVPRIITEEDSSSVSPQLMRRRNFSLVSLVDGEVQQISLVWMGEDYQIVSQTILYSQDQSLAETVSG